MEKFLNVDLLGNLYIEEIFLYYEEPLLFSCRNLFGHLFLINCTDLDDSNKTWLALPISSFKLQQVKRNNISLYDAFINPEDSILWNISQKSGLENAIATRVSPDEVLETDLPRKSAYIEIEKENQVLNSQIKHTDERVTLAKSENRIILDISIEINGGHSTEITPEALAKTVVELQDTIFSIAHKKGTINSKFPNEIIEENQLNIVSTYAASFGIRFMSKQLCDIFGDLKVSRNISIFVELLKIADNPQKAKVLLEDLNPKVGVHYRRLLTNLIANNASVRLYHTTPQKTMSSISLSLPDLKASLNTLESEIDNKTKKINLSGVLVGVNVKNMSFVFQVENEKAITGKISKVVTAKKFTVPLNATVTLDENIKINKVTGKEEVSYTLSNILK